MDINAFWLGTHSNQTSWHWYIDDETKIISYQRAWINHSMGKFAAGQLKEVTLLWIAYDNAAKYNIDTLQVSTLVIWGNNKAYIAEIKAWLDRLLTSQTCYGLRDPNLNNTMHIAWIKIDYYVLKRVHHIRFCFLSVNTY